MPNSSELRAKLITSIDKVIHEGHWDASLFFKNILKRLTLIREAVVSELDEGNVVGAEQADPNISAESNAAERPGYKKVYVTIYQADSGRIDRWNAVIKALVEHCMSRPIYQAEAEAQEVIRNKHSHTDAYVTVWVKETDILQISNNEKLRDRFGYELVVLKEGSVKLENVVEFWREGKQTVLQNGMLT